MYLSVYLFSSLNDFSRPPARRDGRPPDAQSHNVYGSDRGRRAAGRMNPDPGPSPPSRPSPFRSVIRLFVLFLSSTSRSPFFSLSLSQHLPTAMAATNDPFEESSFANSASRQSELREGAEPTPTDAELCTCTSEDGVEGGRAIPDGDAYHRHHNHHPIHHVHSSERPLLLCYNLSSALAGRPVITIVISYTEWERAVRPRRRGERGGHKIAEGEGDEGRLGRGPFLAE